MSGKSLHICALACNTLNKGILLRCRPFDARWSLSKSLHVYPMGKHISELVRKSVLHSPRSSLLGDLSTRTVARIAYTKHKSSESLRLFVKTLVMPLCTMIPVQWNWHWNQRFSLFSTHVGWLTRFGLLVLFHKPLRFRRFILHCVECRSVFCVEHARVRSITLRFFNVFGIQTVTWLILPVVICLSQRLSHACLSINNFIL